MAASFAKALLMRSLIYIMAAPLPLWVRDEKTGYKYGLCDLQKLVCVSLKIAPRIYNNSQGFCYAK